MNNASTSPFASAMASIRGFEEGNIVLSVLLHLSPGVLIALCYGLLASFLRPLGLPSLLSLVIVAAVILTPLELGFLLWLGKKAHGKPTLQGIVCCQEKTPFWQSVGLVAVLVVWAAVTMTLLGFVDREIIKFFAWVPASYMLTEDLTVYSKPVLIVTAALSLVFTGVMAPWVEELYFRGYLMPRIPVQGRWAAPVINALLFALYHFWSPWSLVSRFLAVLPMCVAVYWKKDLRLGIWTHCLLNVLSGVMLLVQVMQ